MTKLAHWPMSSLLSCDVNPWSIVCPTVVVCFNFKFALIEFRLKRFLSFIRIALCPLCCLDCRFGTLTEFDTLAEFDKVAENSFGSLPMVELSSSINIPLALLAMILNKSTLT